MGNLTSTLSIKLNDDVSGPAARAAGALRKLGDSGTSLKRLAAASPDAARLIAQLEKLKQAAAAIEAFKTASRGLGDAGQGYRAAQQNLARINAEMAKAKALQESLKGKRGKEEERQAAAKDVRQLERQARAAAAAVKDQRAAVSAQIGAVRQAQAGLSAAAPGANNLKAAEAGLAAATAQANAQIAKQPALLSAIKSGSDAAAAASRRMAAGMATTSAASRRMVDGMSAQSRATRANAEVERKAHADRAAARRSERRETLGLLASGAGVKAAHGVGHGAHATLETYREFDKERRFGKAVMGLTDADQKPLVDQAIHMGASTKYNDVQVLEGQRELAARGLKLDQVMGLMEPAADLGMSLDLNLPAAVKQMEGALFGFKKDISTLDAAKASARQTADLQVKAAKVSGMTPEDLVQSYKYAATPARMAGVSEAMMLAFAGVSKKANMGGDESGVAFRALIANTVSPTRKGKEAMLANGLNFKNYQKNPDKLALAPFVENIAGQYGVKLNKKAQGELGKIFGDKSVFSDPAKFAPAVMKVLGDTLGGSDAKSKKSIAGAANRYRDASTKGVEVNALIADLMKKLPGNLQLANAFFGSKQGARIATALGDPEVVRHIVEELEKHSEGYAKKVSTERMAGFDGAKSRFEGAVKNLETAVGRAWDNEGNGGLLTGLTDVAGRATQALAELPNGAVQAGSALAGLAGIAAGAFGAFRIAKTLLGFGSGAALSASALALDGSAAALTAAAGRLGVAGAAGAASAGAGTAGGAAAGAAAGSAMAVGAVAGGIVAGGVAASVIANEAVKREEFAKPYLDNPLLGADPAGYGFGAGIVHAQPPGTPWAEGGAEGKPPPQMPRSWRSRDVSRGAGATAPGTLPYRREKTWSETFFGAKAPLDVNLPAPGLGSAMRRAAGAGASPVDAGAIDAARGKADALKSTLDGIGSTSAAPQVDTSGVERVKQMVEEGKAALAQLGATTASPQVSVSGLDEAISKARTLISLLSSVPGAAASANAAAASVGSGGGGVRRALSNNHSGG